MAETIEIVRMRLVRVIEAGREEHAKLSERYAVLVAERDSLRNQRDQRPTVEDGLMLRGVSDAMPETWHVGKPLDVRVRLLVEGWRIAVRIASDADAAEARAEALATWILVNCGPAALAAARPEREDDNA